MSTPHLHGIFAPDRNESGANFGVPSNSPSCLIASVDQGLATVQLLPGLRPRKANTASLALWAPASSQARRMTTVCLGTYVQGRCLAWLQGPWTASCDAQDATSKHAGDVPSKKATRRAKSFLAIRAQMFAAFAASGWANVRVLSPKVRADFWSCGSRPHAIRQVKVI